MMKMKRKNMAVLKSFFKCVNDKKIIILDELLVSLSKKTHSNVVLPKKSGGISNHLLIRPPLS